ncbi:insulinase family protein [Patescibacteria group bacterium]|nr:insulinase family protein [Patescibacteria group bacterium]MBU4458679.1 insulinase family protein [Patescibacteria group bacterium]MCG2696274.1 insulinase family protein [Candidatus Portnoybacteria bacterium]
MSRPYQKFTFKNGLRLVAVPMKNTKAVTVLVLVGTGSKYETKEINGISHFLEHMFFKGTKKRPNTLVIAEMLDKVGGQFNAFTDKEMTGYWAKVDIKHIELALDWVSDIFLNSKLDPKEIEREKGVIIEELNMYLDNPSRYIGDLWDKLLYKNQPAGWLISGEKETIKKMARRDFTNYLKSHYSSHNTVIAVAGNINHNIKDKIKEYFKAINMVSSPQKKKTIEKQNKPEVLVHYKKTDQTHLFLGVRGYDMFHPDKYVLSVLGVILGGNMSSRLWIKIREREGLAYYVKTGTDNTTDTGCLYTRVGADNNRVDRTIKIILENYQLMKDEKIGKEELKKAKDFMKGRTILAMEESDEQAGFYANQELMENKILTLDEIFAKIEAVTADDIQRVARDIFKQEKLNLALIGPFKDKAKFERLLKL